MKGTWLASTKYIINGLEYYKCGNCGEMQRLDIFDNHMRFCSNCCDYKTVVHRIVEPQNVTKRW